MLKKTIKYTDYFGETREEDFFFNLNQAELIEMNMSQAGGIEAMIKRIIAEKDSKQIFGVFKTIIGTAYGEKSLDGKRFIKSKELTDAFFQTEAYNQLILELFENAEYAAEFIRGILPSEASAPSDKPVMMKTT